MYSKLRRHHIQWNDRMPRKITIPISYLIPSKSQQIIGLRISFCQVNNNTRERCIYYWNKKDNTKIVAFLTKMRFIILQTTSLDFIYKNKKVRNSLN